MRSFDKLVSCLKRLPGVGPKQAERLAIHILRAPRSDAEALASAMLRAKDLVKSCRLCLNYTEENECRSLLCVVEQPADVTAIERSQGFRGVYHVLHGRLSPLRGVGPENIRINELVKRLGNGSTISEVILATDPDTEGEATALYLAQTLKGLPVRVTRIAQGVPMGGHLDYMDEQTISTAMKTRREFSGGSG